MRRIRVGLLRRVAALVALASLAACGVTASGPAAFEQVVIGPGGGTLQSNLVLVTIPAGAFPGDQPCAVIPQPNLLPIDPGAGTIVYITGVTCVAPRGTTLSVAGALRHCFDPGAIPLGSTESDVVLLEWDEANAWMEVASAVLDSGAHCLEDTNYPEFGFVAVGVRTSPPAPEFDFVFQGSPEVEMERGAAGQVVPPGLILADSTGSLAPDAVGLTDGAVAYLASRDGSRVMFTLQNVSPYTSSLRTFDVPPVGPNDQREVLADGTFTESTNYYGWLGDQDRVYHEVASGLLSEGQVVARSVNGVETFAAVPGGGGPVVDLVTKTGDSIYLGDARVSPDRTMVLIQWTDYSSEFDVYVDIIDATTGAPIVTDVAHATSYPYPNVRWLPDSSGVYWIDSDQVTVKKAAVPSGTVTTLYTCPASNSVLKDFVVAPPFPPAGQRCAYVREDQSLIPFGFASEPVGPDFFETDLLAGGDVQSTDLMGVYSVTEMAPLFSDNWATSMVLVALTDSFYDIQTDVPSPPDGHTLLFDLGSASLLKDIPVLPSRIDLGRSAGREGHFLVWIETPDPSYPEYPDPGVYELDAFGNVLGNVTPPGWVVTGPPRWLLSWRFAPGTLDYDPRVR